MRVFSLDIVFCLDQKYCMLYVQEAGIIIIWGGG
jgi:hypothetical protein